MLQSVSSSLLRNVIIAGPRYWIRLKSSYKELTMKGYPAYRIYGETCVLNIKPIPASFKRVGRNNDGLALNRAGKMLFEFIPRGAAANSVNQDDAQMFALSPEEMGEILAIAPTSNTISDEEIHDGADVAAGISLVRKYQKTITAAAAATTTTGGMNFDKSLTVIPNHENLSVEFTLDFLDSESRVVTNKVVPSELHVTAQAGEFEVMKGIFKNSMLSLTGWDYLIELEGQRAVRESL